MHNGDTFTLDVVRERYLRPGTENLATTATGDRDGDNRDNLKSAHLAHEAAAPRATFAKNITNDSGKNKAKVEAPAADKVE
eukprot:jgi/Tetstr1/423217/TSEL_001335.t1